MHHALSAITVLLLSTVSGLAKPVPRAPRVVPHPIARRLTAVDTASHNAVQIDQHRARVLRDQALHPGPHPDAALEHVTNPVVMYMAGVDVGRPATQYNLIVDTGSSNTWVGAQTLKPYNPTATSHLSPNLVSVSYGSGSFTGNEFDDEVTIAGVVIQTQGVGAARVTNGFQGIDGVLGLGPTDLTIGTLTPDSGSSISTVVDSLVAQGSTGAAVLGVSLSTISSGDSYGSLSFGGPDPAEFTGIINFVPITATSPASLFWGFDATATYGANDVPILPTTAAGIVDMGTTLILLATDAFQAYQQATGATVDATTGLLTIADPSTLQSLFFNAGGETFELTANAQIWPRTQNAVIGGDPGVTYLVVSDLGTPLGSGLDFILGYSFLERFYSLYDTDNHQVGFATTRYTYATTN